MSNIKHVGQTEKSCYMFKVGDFVKHIKTGGSYKITQEPVHFKKLEYCNEEYYEYEQMSTGQKWVRRKSQMEDGRFILNT